MARQSASQRRAAASLEISVGLSDEVVELASTGVSLHLRVPRIRSKLLKPRLKVGKVLTGQLGNGKLKLLNAHNEGKLQDWRGFGKSHRA